MQDILWSCKTQYNKDVDFPQIDKLVNAISTEVQARFFLDTDKIIRKYIWNSKGTRVDKITLKKKNKVGMISLPNFKAYIAIASKQCGIGRMTDIQSNATEKKTQK